MNKEIEIESYAPWLVMLTVVGGILRVLLLGTKGMWLDEAFSVWIASHSVGEMMQWIVKIDQHPPLYYLLLHFWIAFKGDGAYYVRLLSVLFGTAAIPLIFLIGKRLSGPTMGLGAAATLAFSPFHIYYAQETRMYTLLMFNAAAAIYALARLLTDPCSVQPIGSQFRGYLRAWRTPPEPAAGDEFSYRSVLREQSGLWGWMARHRWSPIQTVQTDLAWVALILFSAATLYSHNTAILFPIAVNIFVLGLILFERSRKPIMPVTGKPVTGQPAPATMLFAPSFGNWVKSQAAVLILWLPWLVPFIKQASGVYHRFWIPQPTWDSVLQTLKSYLYIPGPIPASMAAVIWVLYGLVLCLGLLYFRRKMAQFAFLAALFAIPLLGELIVSIWRPIFYDRTLIWITVPMYLAVGAGITQLRLRPLVLVALGVFATVNLFTTGDYYRYYPKEDWNGAARSVAGYTQKNDLVLFNSNAVEIPFQYYFKSYEAHYYIEVEKRGLPQDLFASGVMEPEMTEGDVPALLSLLKDHQRVWLVYSHESYTDPHGIIPKTLASQMKLVKTDDFYGGQVMLYERP